MSDKESSDLAEFVQFVMDGFLSLPGGSVQVPAKILQDTAALQSFIQEGVMPFSNDSTIVSDVPVKGFGMKIHRCALT